jgi:hypothetical protein
MNASQIDLHIAAVLLRSAATALQPAAAAVQPATALLLQYAKKWEPVMAPAIAAAAPHAKAAAQWGSQQMAAVDAHVAALQPWQLVAATVIATLLVLRVLQALRSATRTLQDKGARCVASCGCGLRVWCSAAAPPAMPPCLARACWRRFSHLISSPGAGWRQVLAALVLDLPLVRGHVAAKQAALAEQIRSDLRKKAAAGDGLLLLLACCMVAGTRRRNS